MKIENNAVKLNAKSICVLLTLKKYKEIMEVICLTKIYGINVKIIG